MSKIVGLSDDIKLNLAATDIRIEAPIPGKAAIGIEVPNKENTVVGLRELLESKTFREFPSKLAFAVGKGHRGQGGGFRYRQNAAHADRRLHRLRKVRLHQYADHEHPLQGEAG